MRLFRFGPRLERRLTTRIYHITSRFEADNAVKSGAYAPAAFAAEGFIHCSYVQQLRTVATSRFKGRSDLVLLEIDRARLQCATVDENLAGGAELFPHIYGHLPMAAVVKIHEFPCNGSGDFDLWQVDTGTQRHEDTKGPH